MKNGVGNIEGYKEIVHCPHCLGVQVLFTYPYHRQDYYTCIPCNERFTTKEQIHADQRVRPR